MTRANPPVDPHLATPRRRGLFARFGPGLVTGVADDDPSGIATYAQAGAQFGWQLLWTMPFAWPLMAAVQSLCARLGRVTGRGLAANLQAVFPRRVATGLVLLLVVANICNLAADLAAMGEAAALVTGLDRHALALGFAGVSLVLQVWVPYHRYVVFLKWLALSLLAYAAVVFSVKVPWPAVWRHTFWPQALPDASAAMMIVGVFGTTISPYLFFWQASEEVEEMQRHRVRPLRRAPGAAAGELRRIAWDTWSGMFYSNLTAWFIIVATAATLHAAGVTQVESAAQAAAALRPIAGDFAFALFALGIVGTGLIGVPVLAGANAYAVAELCGWRSGLERKAGEARGFYGVLALSVVGGALIHFSPLPPLRALFLSAVLNGLVAVPLMVAVLLLARRRDVLGEHVAGWSTLALGWLAVGVMTAAAIGMGC